MRRGTTPTFIFEFPFDVESVQAVHVAFSQSGENILTKEDNECTLSRNTVSVQLTQDETYMFAADGIVEVQARILTADEQAVSSDVVYIKCKRSLTEDILI